MNSIRLGEIAKKNMDGVLQAMEEINGWLYGHLGRQSVCDLEGEVFRGQVGAS